MRTFLRGLGGIVVVAAVGFLWAHYGLKRTVSAPPALSRRASVADFTVDFPSAWHVAAARSDPTPPLSDELALAATDAGNAQLVIGTAHPPAPGGLPSSLESRLGAVPRPEIVSLGGVRFYRYLNVTPSGGGVSESIYALPTTIGTVTAICSAANPSLSFTSTCERVLATVRLSSGTVLSLGGDTGYALALNRILDQLNAARRSAAAGLRSTDVATRARAAAVLASAHSRAASAAAHLSPANVSAANPALVAALHADAAGYRALAGAAGRGDVRGYARAQREIVTATKALDAAFGQLRRLGYTIG